MKKLHEIMTRNPEYILPETTLREAALKMRTLNVGMLPVGDGGKLKGTVTDRDLTIRASAEGFDPGTTSVADVMTRDVVYAFEDQTIEEAIDLMKVKQIRRLIILNSDNDMTGIVALADLGRECEEEHKARALEAVSRD